MDWSCKLFEIESDGHLKNEDLICLICLLKWQDPHTPKRLKTKEGYGPFTLSVEGIDGQDDYIAREER